VPSPQKAPGKNKKSVGSGDYLVRFPEFNDLDYNLFKMDIILTPSNTLLSREGKIFEKWKRERLRETINKPFLIHFEKTAGDLKCSKRTLIRVVEKLQKSGLLFRTAIKNGRKRFYMIPNELVGFPPRIRRTRGMKCPK